MYSSILTGAVFGIEAYLLTVETDISKGLPTFTMVGFLSGEMREAGERVRVALRNAGVVIPPSRITVNFSPADIPKRGAVVDLPVAAGILMAMGILRPAWTKDTLILGELGLDGEVRPIRAVLPIVKHAAEHGVKTCILPEANRAEGAVIPGIRVIGVRSLKQMIRYLCEPEETRDKIVEPFRLSAAELLANASEGRNEADFREIRGQRMAKRALEIAAAGFHNCLMIGPPGSGKSMLARCMPTILPPLSISEALEISMVYSIAGKIPPGQSMVTERPFLSPHHTVTQAALTGGGAVPQPGVITLANRGVLFMDEFPEFGREKLDLLREPLEEHRILIARSTGSFVYPARFLLLAAMNPCPCGFYPDVNKCRCTAPEIRRYLQRISGPVLDRFDLCVETEKVEVDSLMEGTREETSAAIRARVMKARDIQAERFRGTGIVFNGDMDAQTVERFCPLGREEKAFLRTCFDRFGLTARAYHRILKTARTIADLDGSREINTGHLAEALGYRTADRKYWKSGEESGGAGQRGSIVRKGAGTGNGKIRAAGTGKGGFYHE